MKALVVFLLYVTVAAVGAFVGMILAAPLLKYIVVAPGVN